MKFGFLEHARMYSLRFRLFASITAAWAESRSASLEVDDHVARRDDIAQFHNQWPCDLERAGSEAIVARVLRVGVGLPKRQWLVAGIQSTSLLVSLRRRPGS